MKDINDWFIALYCLISLMDERKNETQKVAKIFKIWTKITLTIHEIFVTNIRIFE